MNKIQFSLEVMIRSYCLSNTSGHISFNSILGRAGFWIRSLNILHFVKQAMDTLPWR